MVEGEAGLLAAMHDDLKKSAYEAYLTEVGLVLDEIRFAGRRLKRWAAPERVRTPVVHWPAASRIHSEPYGVSLIVAPWNYPFQLSAAPLAAAVAAGNCVVVKPSELAPNSAKALSRVVRQAFSPHHVSVVQGGVETSRALLKQRWDKIFFTGSSRVGGIVMAAAARHLTPVTLELGGKSPCIVDRDASLGTAARRIASGKFLNAGQTCVAPDYLLVHEGIKAALAAKIEKTVADFFGPDPRLSPDYPRIVSDAHFERLTGLMGKGRILFGGETDAAERYIAPTAIDGVDFADPIMAEEIFGPLLPVFSFRRLSEAVETVRRLPRPLALYYFGREAARQRRVVEGLSFGGGCINDTLLHLATPHLPFGGVGKSGMGSYHGKAGFDAFSHRKSILKRTFVPDVPLRYPPFFRWKMAAIRRLFR